MLTGTAAGLVGAAWRLAAASGPSTVHIVIRDSAFDASVLRVPSGRPVRFVVTNTDPIDHELVIGDSAVQQGHESGADSVHHSPGAVSVPARSTAATSVRFDEPCGTLFGCHLPGHWLFGMRGRIEVG